MVEVLNLSYHQEARHKEAQYTSLLDFSFTDSKLFLTFLTGW